MGAFQCMCVCVCHMFGVRNTLMRFVDSPNRVVVVAWVSRVALQEGVVSAVCSLSFSPSSTAQSLCATVLSDLAGDEKGRSMISTEV